MLRQGGLGVEACPGVDDVEADPIRLGYGDDADRVFDRGGSVGGDRVRARLGDRDLEVFDAFLIDGEMTRNGGGEEPGGPDVFGVGRYVEDEVLSTGMSAGLFESFASSWDAAPFPRTTRLKPSATFGGRKGFGSRLGTIFTFAGAQT